jgi:class 3 adenylate cyclase
MGFFEILNHIIELLRREGRVSYRALKREFQLDDAFLEDVKEELIEVKGVAVDRDGRMLVWNGETEATPISASQSEQSTPVTHAAPVPPAHDAERRQLTVMFSDVVDSTKLSGQLDPEEYRDVLRAYQHTCTAVIQRFDGYIAQHLGDALLVYFGFSAADEFDAQRGVLAGLGMLEAMHTLKARLQREKGVRLSIRVGIHTGLTVIGDVGAGQKHELLALGEAPNIAARLQSLAEPDTIAISEATYRLVQGYFACDELGSHILKGVAEPQQVYRVRGASGARSRLDIATSRGLTPLVSRLVQVLKDHAASVAHTRLECRSSPYYQHTALYPMIDLLQRTLRFQSDDSPAQRLDKLARELDQYRLPLAETVPLCAALLSLAVPEAQYPPLNVSPQRQRQKTLEAIVSILLELAERQPVLFIIEDLHWLDPTSLALLDLLMDQTPTARLLTLLTCRPEFQPAWSPRSYLTQVALHRLFHEQIERMATHVAGGKPLPEAVLQHIVDKTDGVPLFVEELTKAVLESSMLKEVNGQYAISGSVSSLAIPVTL